MQWTVLLVEIGAERWIQHSSIQDVMERSNNLDVEASGKNIDDAITWSDDALALTARLGDGGLFDLGPRLKGKSPPTRLGGKESARFTLHGTATARV